jgi:hypothetical protein
MKKLLAMACMVGTLALFLLIGCEHEPGQTDPALVSLAVTKQPGKTGYGVGEEFDPAGLEVTGVYTDGASRVVSGYSLSEPDMATAGEKKVTITLDGKTAEFTITVFEGEVPIVLQSLTVTTPPAKVLYLKDEPFESAGLVITGAYSDGTEEIVTDFAIDAATGAAGEIAVTISLEGVSAQTWIYVTAGELASIIVQKGPDKEVYLLGEALDLSGIEIEGVYSDLPLDVSFPLDTAAATASGYDDQQLGPQILTVILNGLSAEFNVIVRNPPSIEFDYGRRRSDVPPESEPSYTAPLRRKLVLAPVKWFISDSAVYHWELDGAAQSAAGEFLTLEFRRGDEIGPHTVTVTVTDGGVSASAQTRVDCVAPEGTYRRDKSGGSQSKANKVYDFTPAPGQFVSLGSSEAAAISFAASRLGSNGSYLSLGGWGGYVIAGFDHSVMNLENKSDLEIRGNGFEGWTEPGVIWVSQDDNGNGIPDDTWYELKGSAHGQDIKRYAVTYYKPAADRGAVWLDNLGNSGAFPGTTYYGDIQGYPNHVPGNYVTFTGTGLSSTVTSGGIIYNPGFEWGYVDNDPEPAYYKIENAVQADGSFIDLKYIDFVKVHTGQNARAGALGEISTEIVGYPRDLGIN